MDVFQHDDNSSLSLNSSGHSTHRYRRPIDHKKLLNSSIPEELTLLFLNATPNPRNDSSPFPGIIDPVTTASSKSAVSNSNKNLAIILASVGAVSLLVLCTVIMLILRWKRRRSVSRLDLAQEFESSLDKSTLSIPWLLQRPRAGGPASSFEFSSVVVVSRDLFGIGTAPASGQVTSNNPQSARIQQATEIERRDSQREREFYVANP